ncbi:hypothetical protein [Endozoicomonas acroporae]|uniref:hypothetical protein n=1 Tax=Endozoicomonas acroporae TaxID=1701104 RepID=UPI003D7C0EF6
MNRLRDHFAGTVLREQLRSYLSGGIDRLTPQERLELLKTVKKDGSFEKHIARVSYAYADAMLEAREESRKGEK